MEVIGLGLGLGGQSWGSGWGPGSGSGWVQGWVVRIGLILTLTPAPTAASTGPLTATLIVGPEVFVSSNAEPQAFHHFLLQNDRAEPTPPPSPVLCETFSRKGPEVERLTMPMQAAINHGKELAREEAYAFSPVEPRDGFPASPPPSHISVSPTSPGIFHLTPPLKPHHQERHHFNFSSTYADPDANAYGRGRVLETKRVYEQIRGGVAFEAILEQLGGVGAELWQMDVSSRYLPFGEDKAITTSGSFIADMPLGEDEGR